MISYVMSSISTNSYSFIDGVKHIPFKQVSHAYPVRANDASASITYTATASYLCGRTVRFIVAVPGTLADIILQLFQCVTISFEALAIKTEALLTGKKERDTYSSVCPFTNLIITARKYTTLQEPWVLAQDLRIKDKLHRANHDIGLIVKLWTEIVFSILELKN
jgi:hypothetical protein